MEQNELPGAESAIQTSVCNGCGAKIVWGTSPSGKKTPFDFKKTMGMMDGGEVIWIRVTHFSTCPKAGEFRKSGK